MRTSTAAGLVGAVFLAGAAAFLLTPSAPVPQAVTPKDQGGSPGAVLADVRLPATLSFEATAGKSYYEAVCASCHGANGAGQAGVAPPLVHVIYEPSHHSDSAFVAAARNGVWAHHWPFGNMPPLAQKLTDAELQAIVVYVREIQRENGIL